MARKEAWQKGGGGGSLQKVVRARTHTEGGRARCTATGGTRVQVLQICHTCCRWCETRPVTLSVLWRSVCAVAERHCAVDHACDSHTHAWAAYARPRARAACCVCVCVASIGQW